MRTINPRKKIVYRHRTREQWRAAAGGLSRGEVARLRAILSAGWTHNDRLTDFEDEFLSNLAERLDRWGRLLRISPKQQGVLDRIEKQLARGGALR